MNVQFCWDCPEPTKETKDNNEDVHPTQSQLQQRLFPVNLLPLPGWLTAKMLPEASLISRVTCKEGNVNLSLLEFSLESWIE